MLLTDVNIEHLTVQISIYENLPLAVVVVGGVVVVVVVVVVVFFVFFVVFVAVVVVVAAAQVCIHWAGGKVAIKIGTWAWLDIADLGLLQSRTGFSSMLWFSEDLPASRLGSSRAATLTAFAPFAPIANFAVHWKFKGFLLLQEYSVFILIRIQSYLVVKILFAHLCLEAWLIHLHLLVFYKQICSCTDV